MIPGSNPGDRTILVTRKYSASKQLYLKSERLFLELEGLIVSSEAKILAVVKSRSGASVRLTVKQWEHIVTARPELGTFMKEVLDVVEQPDEVLEPPRRVKPQLHAVKRFERLSDVGFSQNLVVVYRETNVQEGFIITAFPISDRRKRRMYRFWRRLLV